MSVEISTLQNGLTVVTDRMPHLESAAIGVWVDAGARYETAEVNGVAHLLEHMAFKGTRRRSAQAIAEEIEAVGGSVNAYTGREHTAYYARVLKEDVPLAVDILADIVQHSVFDEHELGREREVVIQEIGQAEDTPDDIVFDHLQAVAYAEQSLGRSILGTLESVRRMERQTLFDFMRRHYSGSRMVLAAAGAVEHDAVVRLAERHFTELPRGEAALAEAALFRGGEFREHRSLEQVHVALALPGVRYEDEDFYASQVMSMTLGGGMSSRLFQELRERRGLCYSVFSFASSYVDSGMLGLYAGTGAEQLEELMRLLREEVHRLGEDANEEEVARGRAQLKAGILMSLESSTARAEQLARQILIYGKPLPAEELVASIEAVDAEKVRKVTRRMLASGETALALLGPLDALASPKGVAAKFA